jgi:hypothetical protein
MEPRDREEITGVSILRRPEQEASSPKTSQVDEIISKTEANRRKWRLRAPPVSYLRFDF